MNLETFSFETLEQIDNLYKEENYPLEVYIYFLNILNDEIWLYGMKANKVKFLLTTYNVEKIIAKSDNLELLIYALDNNLVKREYTLCEMCKYGKLNFIKYLLTDISKIHDNRPLIEALKYCHLEIIEYLLKFYTKNQLEQIIPFNLNNLCFEFEKLKKLLDYFKNDKNIPHRIQRYSLRYAASNGKLDMLKYLFSYFNNNDDEIIKSDNYYMLIESTKNGHTEIVKYLLNYYTDKNEIKQIIKFDKDYVVTLALKRGNKEIIEYLLNYYINESKIIIFDKDFITKLDLIDGHRKIIKYLSDL